MKLIPSLLYQSHIKGRTEGYSNPSTPAVLQSYLNFQSNYNYIFTPQENLHSFLPTTLPPEAPLTLKSWGAYNAFNSTLVTCQHPFKLLPATKVPLTLNTPTLIIYASLKKIKFAK